MPWVDDEDGVDPEWDESSGSGTVVMGGTKLEQLANVSVPSGEAGDQQTILYNATTKLWTPTNIDVVSGVLSVFGRAGIVIAQEGDYTIGQMGDVDTLGVVDGNTLIFNIATGNWEPGDPGASSVLSVFGRQGDVVALANDYTAVLITNTPAGTIAATNVQDAINELDGDINSLGPHNVLAEPIVTGLIDGGILSGVSTTQFQITAGNGVIVDSYTDYDNTVLLPVVWPLQTVNLLNPTTEQQTFVSIDNLGVAVTSNSPPSPSRERTEIVVGSLFHDPLNVDPPTPAHDYNKIGTLGHLLVDYLDFIPIPAHGFELGPGLGGGLEMRQEAGTAFKKGVNEDVDPTNPNIISVIEVDPYSFYYTKGNGEVDPVALLTDVDPTLYDPGGAGVLVPVSNAGGGVRTTIQYTFSIAPGVRVVLYGQTEYTDLETALGLLEVDLTALVIPPELDDAIGPVYAVLLTQAATDLSVPTQAQFVNVIDGAGGGGGGGGVTLVSSVFGRLGDVIAASDDYTAGQVTNVPAGTVIATDVQGAITEIDARITALPPVKTGLDSLDDVTISGPADDRVLVYNTGAGQWQDVALQASLSAYSPTAPLTANNVEDALDEAAVLIGINIGDINTIDNIKPDSDPSGVTGADQVNNMMSLTQAEYDAIGVPDPATIYFIAG